MKVIKIAGVIFVVGLIVIQFIQPVRNQSGQAVITTDITHVVAVPSNVQALFKSACYDCHSNNTAYPWYVKIQPVGWIMAADIKKGKRELNFNEFGSYSARKQISKLKGIATSQKEGSMPISAYKLMHGKSHLNKNDKISIMEWADRTKDSLQIKN